MEEAVLESTIITNKVTGEGGEKSTNTREETVVKSEFVKTNYAALKNLMQEHEKAERVHAAANEVLNATEKAQLGKGLFFTPAHKQKQTMTPTGVTSIRSTKWLTAKKGGRNEGGTTSTEPKRRVQFESATKSSSLGKTRRTLFEEDDDILMYDGEDETRRMKKKKMKKCRRDEEGRRARTGVIQI